VLKAKISLLVQSQVDVVQGIYSENSVLCLNLKLNNTNLKSILLGLAFNAPTNGFKAF
jgi:hypothetical protein